MNTQNDLAEIRGTSIPMFNQHGTALTHEEREAIAKKKGVCVKCGIKTHDVKMFKRIPLTTDHVYDGKCIRCFSNSVPISILKSWENKFKTAGFRCKKFRMVGRIAALSVQSGKSTEQDLHRRQSGTNENTEQATSNSIHPNWMHESTEDFSSEAMKLSTTSERSSRPTLSDNSLTSLHLETDGNVSSSGRVSNSNSPLSVVVSSEMIFDDYKGASCSYEACQFPGVLREKKNQREILTPVLHCLRNAEHGNSSSIHAVSQIMEVYFDDSRVLALCCGAIWAMIARNSELCVKVVESGAVKSIVDSLYHPPCNRDNEFVQWATGSITTLAQNSLCREVILNAGGIEVILAIMKQHQVSAGVHEWSCRGLFSLIYGSNEQEIFETQSNISSICDAGGLVAIVEGMSLHCCESVAQFWATKLLLRIQEGCGNTSISARLKEKIVKVGGIIACCKILKTRSCHAVVFESTATLLYKLLIFAGSDGIEKAADSMLSLVRKMNEIFGNNNLRLVCCKILGMLLPSNRVQFNEIDGLKAVLSAMSAAKDNLLCQRACIEILWNVSFVPTLFDQSYLAKSFEALSIAHRLYPDDIELFTAACGFLANVAIFPGIIFEEIPYHIPIHVLSLQEQQSELNDQAGRAIGNMCTKSKFLTRKILELNGIQLMLICLSSNSPQVVQVLLYCLTSISLYSEEYTYQIIESGCLELCKETIETSSSLSLLEQALRLVSTLCHCSHGISFTLPGNIIFVIIQAMKVHLNKPDSLELACCTLQSLMLLVPPDSKEIDSSGIVDYMIDIISARSLPVDLKGAACGVLWSYNARQIKHLGNDLLKMFRSIVGVIGLYNGEIEPYDASLQIAASAALISITQSMSGQSHHISCEEMEVIITVMYMVIYHDPDRIVLLENFLDCILNISFISESEVILSGGIVVVIDTMVEHESSESVQERGCAILAHLSSSENLQVNICLAETDGIDMIINSLAVFSSNTNIQINACKALSHLTVEKESRILILAQGGLMSIVNAINNDVNNQCLLNEALTALLNLSADADEQLLMDDNVVGAVIDTMRRHVNYVSLQEKCLSILQNISMRFFNAKSVIGTAGGIDAIFTTMKEHIGTSAVLERSFVTLWSLAIDKTIQEEISSLESVRILINGMMANIQDQNVQKQACGCLCTLSSNSENKTLIREVGGVNAIVFSMWAHFDSEALQIEACKALSSLAVNMQTNEVMIASDGEVKAIITAMRLYPESQKLQEHACVALRNFMLSEENSQLMKTHAKELIQVMKHAATRFPNVCHDRANQVLVALGNNMILQSKNYDQTSKRFSSHLFDSLQNCVKDFS
jgi:hypothetical protein